MRCDRAIIGIFLSVLVGCGDHESTLTNVSRLNTEAPLTTEAQQQSSSEPLKKPVRSDWPQMGGLRNDHSSPETGLSWDWPDDGPTKLWSRTCGTGYGMPVTAGELTFVLARAASGRTTLTARNVATGEPAWTWDGPVAAYADDFDDYSDGPYSTPCVGDTDVVAITEDGRLVRWNRDDGTVLDELDLLDEFAAQVGPFPWGTSPLAVSLDGREVLIINVGGAGANGKGAGVVCLDRKTLETVWQSTTEGRSYATPRLARVGAQNVVIVFTNHNVIGLDLATGEKLWGEPFGGRGDPKTRVNAVSPLVIPGNAPRVFVTAGPGTGLIQLTLLPAPPFVSVDKLGRRTLDSQFNNLTTDGERLYGFTSKWNRQAVFRCIDLETGQPLWDHEGELQRGASAFVDGRLLLLGEAGQLAVLEASEHGPTVLTQTPEPVIEGPCFTAPVVAGGRLFIRTEREVACFDLTP